MARGGSFHLGLFVLAVCTAVVLWGMAHGTSSIERAYDLPVVLHGIPEDLVVTDQSADVVNVRVLGSRAALRNLPSNKLEYAVDVSGSRPGPAVYEVDVGDERIKLPRGARIVSRSPASIELKLERRGRKSVRVRPDLEGEPAQGFVVTRVDVEPPRVWLEGARSEVLRMSDVATETIDVAGIQAPDEREVRLSLGGGHVWRAEPGPVKVRIQVEAAAESPPAPPPGRGG